MKMDVKSIGVGLVAGIASALLVLAALSHASYSLLFLILAGIPVFIAGLGFGAAASVAALAASFATLSLLSSPVEALSILVLPQIPVAWMSYQANMARPADEIGGPKDVMAWYPLSDMLLHMAALVAIAFSATLIVSGYDLSTAAKIVNAIADAMAAQDPSISYDPQTRAALVNFYYLMLPLMQALTFVIAIFASYYFSALIVRASMRSLRPREDMPSTLRMHSAGLFIFLAGMVLMFFGGQIGVVGAAICGAFGGGFLLSGLAAFHMRTRGKSWRTPALVLAYLTIFLSGFFFIAAGLMDTRRAVALTPKGNSDNEDN